MFPLMPSVSPLRCNQTTGLSTATFRDCRSVSFSVLAAMATAEPPSLWARWPWNIQNHTTSQTATQLRLSHSERAITQPDAERRSPRLSGMSKHKLYNSRQTKKHSRSWWKKKVVCCCLFLLNFAVKGGFQCTCSKRVASLRVLKPAIQTTPTDCV